MNKTRGFFTRVLVNLDMLVELPSQLLMECHGFAFVVEIEYERLPSFCHACKIIGHSFSICKKHILRNFPLLARKQVCIMFLRLDRST